MKSKKFEGSMTRTVLTSLIVDTVFCGKVAGQWTVEGLFDASWANLIGGWCVRYFKKYGKAPNDHIGKIFEMWATGPHVNDELSGAVEKFLAGLSDNHDEAVSEFSLDLAATYFDRVRAERAIEAAIQEIAANRVGEAVLRLQQLSGINLGEASYVDVGNDPDAWDRAFNRQQAEPLVSYRGDLGEFTKGAFCRGEFYAFLAPDKTGKTTWLLDFAYQAVRQRNRVLYVDLGDSSEEEVLLRLGCRSAKRPEWEEIVPTPNGWDEHGLLRVDTVYPAASSSDSYHKFRSICKTGDAMRLSVHRNSTLSVGALDQMLADWARLGWKPDVICCDYADILAKPAGMVDPIQVIDENWKAMRRLSQERDCLLMTATQTKSTGYLKTDDLLGPEDFSGSKTKNAHVNGILGINVSKEDKDQGLTRLNWVLRRRGYSNVSNFVLCAGAAPLGNPCMVSQIGKRMENPDKFRSRGRDKPKAAVPDQPVAAKAVVIDDSLDIDLF